MKAFQPHGPRRHSKRPSWQGQEATTLTELTIALALLSVLGLGAGAFLQQHSRVFHELKYAMTMRQIAERVAVASARPDVISASARYRQFLPPEKASGNQLLADCISPPPNADPSSGITPSKSPCVVTDPNQAQAFDLILPIQTTPTLELVAKQTLASGSSSVFYDLNGRKDCLPQTDDATTATTDGDPQQAFCQFAARAFFWATCPPAISTDASVVDQADNSYEVQSVQSYLERGEAPPFAPSTCTTAQTIHVRYQIVHRYTPPPPTGPSNLPRRQMASIPSADVFAQPARGALAISVDLLPQDEAFEFLCPEHYTITGMQDGQAVCECLYPFSEITSQTPGYEGSKVCVSNEQLCQSQERYRGVYLHSGAASSVESICGRSYGINDHGKAICCPITCIKVNDLNAACQAGGWIEKVKAEPGNSCIAAPCNIEDEDERRCEAEVDCAGSITCCYEVDPRL